MSKKALTLILGLGLTALALSAPQVEAIAFCSPTFCASRPSTAVCACPPGTDRVGSPSNCSAYMSISRSGCWYE